jgi:hypothetical protein
LPPVKRFLDYERGFRRIAIRRGHRWRAMVADQRRRLANPAGADRITPPASNLAQGNDAVFFASGAFAGNGRIRSLSRSFDHAISKNLFGRQPESRHRSNWRAHRPASPLPAPR